MSQQQHDADPTLTLPRERMLALLRREIGDERVIEAMASVPRERFVPPEFHDRAYDDCALPVGASQTISQPLIVAIMTEALEPAPNDHVLDVGTGSGYQAAVLSRLVRDVVTVERVADLRIHAEFILRELGFGNVHAFPAADILGRPRDALYDGIVVAAGAPHVPRALIDQLAPGGRLIIPVGDRNTQQLIRARRTSHGVSLDRLGPCAFVPLLGPGAWPENDSARASRRSNVR